MEIGYMNFKKFEYIRRESRDSYELYMCKG